MQGELFTLFMRDLNNHLNALMRSPNLDGVLFGVTILGLYFPLAIIVLNSCHEFQRSVIHHSRIYIPFYGNLHYSDVT